MREWEDDAELEALLAEEAAEEERRELSPAGIAEANRDLVRQQALFRRAADLAADALSGFEEVARIALFGSAARRLWKGVPRFRTYRRAGIALWHECRDVDLAVWLDRLDRLRATRRSINRALPALHRDGGSGVASHQIDIFVLEPGTDRYLGRMCQFKARPAHKLACRVPGCGASPFLQQHQGFVLKADALAPASTVRLFDRATGERRRAVDLPPPA